MQNIPFVWHTLIRHQMMQSILIIYIIAIARNGISSPMTISQCKFCFVWFLCGPKTTQIMLKSDWKQIQKKELVIVFLKQMN
jgi:hypothetical protein